MNLKLRGKMPASLWHKPLKIILLMKLSFLVLTIAFLQVSIAGGFAQKISLNENKTSLTKVFEKIKTQSGYHFFWKGNDLENFNVTVKVENATVEEAMAIIIKDLPLHYVISRNSIVIKSNNEKSTENQNIQATTLTGKVIDAAGNPIPGTTIKIDRILENNAKGFSKALSTKGNGTYEFSNLEAGRYKIAITCLGFLPRTEEITVASGKSNSFNFVLQDNEENLDQVVVTGYGSVNRNDLTGAVGSVDRKTIENSTITSLDQLLQGKVSGVDVMISSGMPGAAVKVRIRGNTSLLGNNDPLYVVDGIPVITDKNYAFNQTTGGDIRENLSGLLNINLNDVESIDILKDASATAIYGSRGANGVVIITTRKGIPGQKPVINVGYDYGFQRMDNEYRPLNSREFREIMTEAAHNGSPTLLGWWADMYPHMGKILTTPEEYFGKEDINWLKMMTDSKASSANFNISSRGGSENLTYYLSYSNNRNNGVLKGSGLERNAGKLQLDAFINPSLRVGTNVSISNSNTDIKRGGLNSLLSWRPDLPIYNEGGSFYSYNDSDNPLAASTEINNSSGTGLSGSGFLELQLLKGLFFKSSLAFSYDLSKTSLYFPVTTIYGRQENGVGEQSLSENMNRIFDNTLNYNKIWNDKHDLNALVGASYEHLTSQFFTAIGRGFPNDQILNI